MTPMPLPEFPNLEQLKKQSKSLLRAAQAADSDALARMARLPAFSQAPHRMDINELALHDAQSVIAREHGFPSWKALRDEVEARTLSFAEATEAFVRAASDGAPDRAKRLLALYPAIANATFEAELLLGDAPSVERRLRSNPGLATKPGGPQQRDPLLYVCHTCLHREQPQRMDGLLAIARQLLSLGANPNAEYKWNWHPELPRTALWAALVTLRHTALAAILLEAGANPSDGVTPQIAAGGGDIEALELLHRFGLNPNGAPGGVPPLAYMMTWSEEPRGARWLLEHGADPNLPWGPDGEAPLHSAARRWDLPMAELLITHGADPMQRRADGYTAHSLAELHGNHEVAKFLLQSGARSELTPLEQFIAATARADRAAADAVMALHPHVRQQLTPVHHLMLHRHAENGNAEVLAVMLERGFDPNVPDHDGVTALHRAAMGGHPAAAATLIKFGARLDALDGMFAAAPLVWAVEGRRSNAQPGSDHVSVARVLIDAGSPLDWDPPKGAPGPERTLDGLRELRADVRRSFDGRST